MQMSGLTLVCLGVRMGEQQMSWIASAPRKRQRSAEAIAPALALLAQQMEARRVAGTMGVSTATVLNWMDWAWKNRVQVEPYLHGRYPDLTQQQWDGLWLRIARRRARRERRLDLVSVLARP
jgi:hypothetical protein